jgi:hypothetical protein
MVPFHDHTIESVLVHATERRLVVRAFDPHASSRSVSVAEFTGLAGYCFEGDILGTILFDIEECDPAALYDQYAVSLHATYATTGAHAPWVATSESARAFISTNSIRGFELSVSIGAPGAIWCRGFRTWTENADVD